MTKGPCVVMCCGCSRMLGKDSQLVETSTGICAVNDVAIFKNPDEADLAAARAGWQIKDHTGANHRCPECLKLGASSEKIGAYVPWPRP